MAKQRLLLIDDDSDAHAVLEQLCDGRFELSSCKDVNEAVRLYNEQSWDLVLIDLNLLLVRGDRLVDILRRQTPASGHPPLAYYSAEDESRLEALAGETKVKGAIPKGLRSDEMLARLDALLA